MDKTSNQKLKLGVFVIVGTLLFIAAVFFIGKKQNMFGNTFEIYAVFNNINGLKAGNNVRYSGINVGTVKEITMLSDTVIVVKFAIQEDITHHVKTDAKCIITSDGLVGSMIINVLPGTQKGQMISPGDTLKSISRIQTDEMLQRLSETNENAALLTEEILKITKGISAGKGLIGAIITDPTMSSEFKEIMSNVNTTVKATTMTMTKINAILHSLDKKDNLMGAFRDPAVATNVKNIIKNVEKSSSGLILVMQSLDSVLLITNELVTNAKDGKGLINYLSNDPTLVHKIDNTVESIDATVLEVNKAGIKLNENLEALKSTWLLKRYFKKQEEERDTLE